MAEDLTRLVVTLEATTKSFERQIAKLEGTTVSALKAMEKSAQAGGQRVGEAMSRGMAAGSANLGKFQSATLAAQLNDIAVSVASGQSPFTVMLQQGAQISQIFGSQTGVRGALGAVGGALVSMVNPVNIALFAILGLGAAALSYFGKTKDEAEKVKEVLKAHGELIGSIKDRYGDAMTGVREFGAESQRVLQALAQTNIGNIAKEYDNLSKSLATSLGKLTVGVDINTGKSIGTIAPEIRGIVDAVVAFQGSIRSGTPDVSTFREALSNIALTTADKRIRETAQEMLTASANASQLSRALSAAEGLLGRLSSAASGASESVAGFSAALGALRGISPTPLMDTEKAALGLKNALANALDPNDVKVAYNEYEAAIQRIKDAQARDDGRYKAPKRTPESEFAKQIKNEQESIANLQAEQKALGMTKVEALAYTQAERMKNAVISEGKTLTPQQTAQIEQLARQYAELRIQTDELKASQDRAKQATASFVTGTQDLVGNFGVDFKNAMMAGESAADSFRTAMANMTSAVADMLIRMAAQMAIAMAFQAMGVPVSPGMFPALPFGGGRAGGGRVVGGRAYRVGESGPETVVMGGNGMVYPDRPTTKQSSNVYSIDSSVHINAPNSDAAALARLEARVTRQLAEQEQRLPKIVSAHRSHGRM